MLSFDEEVPEKWSQVAEIAKYHYINMHNAVAQGHVLSTSRTVMPNVFKVSLHDMQ